MPQRRLAGKSAIPLLLDKIYKIHRIQFILKLLSILSK
jgi:hypothetical protein